MGRQAPHRGVGPDGQRKALPGLPTVARAEHGARLARGGLAAPGEQHARVVGLHHDAARIRQRPLRFHADRRPRLAAIGAPEHLAVRAHETRGGLVRAIVMSCTSRSVKPVDDHARPRVAAVAAPDRPRRSRCRPRLFRSSGSTSTRGDERRADGALCRGVDVEPLPRCIRRRASDRRRPAASRQRGCVGSLGSTANDQIVGRSPAAPIRAQDAPPSRLANRRRCRRRPGGREARPAGPPAPGCGCSAGTACDDAPTTCPHPGYATHPSRPFRGRCGSPSPSALSPRLLPATTSTRRSPPRAIPSR